MKLTHNYLVINDKIGFLLILAGSLLLGIWAVRDTIALRNLLLSFGAAIGLLYFFLVFKKSNIKILYDFENLIPLSIIFFLMVWIPYLSMSVGSFANFTGTWIRCILAVVFGGSIGLALLRNNCSAPLLWLGILLSFIVVFIQYLLAQQGSNSYYFTDWEGDTYLYMGKINAVLMGVIFLAGFAGNLLDLIKTPIAGVRAALWVLFFLSIILISYLFIFAFNTNSGIGLIIILAFLLTFFLLVFKINQPSFLIFFALFFLSLFLIVFYFYISSNDWWISLIEDILISSRVDQNLEWMKVDGKHNFPLRENGEFVSGHVYERVSWAIVGLRLIGENPLGTGILEFPFGYLIQNAYPQSTIFSSHSAWIELTLSFGWLFIILIFLLFGINIVKALLHSNHFKYLTIMLSFVILIIYGVGELNTKHGVEILFFMIGLISFIQLKNDTVIVK